MKYKEAGQLVGLVLPTRKIKRVTGKGREDIVALEKSAIERGDTTKGDDTIGPVVLWNKMAWGFWKIQEESALDLLREGIMRWRKRNITRRLFKYLNITSLAWRVKLKGVGKT